MFDNFSPNNQNQSPAPVYQPSTNGPQDIFDNVAPANSHDAYSTKTFGPPSSGQNSNISSETGSSFKFLIIGLVTLVFVLVAGAVAYQMILKPKFQNAVINQSSSDSIPEDSLGIANNSSEVTMDESTTTEELVLDSDLDVISATGTQDAVDIEIEDSSSTTVNNLMAIDTDGDGVTDDIEALKGTNPANKDSDADGLDDGLEISQYLTDPLKSDSDSDGLSDHDEVSIYLTDPLSKDTDGDGYEDGVEVKNGYNPKGSGRLIITTTTN